ncbi:MAG TPA: hypothetical protein P5318_18800 [Candidatus Hydrogenedentes bacterium]|nr:hypothetical protein [Candidatus Hydrogenedentota bacterium]HPC16865.1 hypothetical protein [Candidatus Hydrogenedentota bacterium]HRT22157.1 hypothetical protein [Candidatus Hydrogenedentota bacterium]HRT22164.1 hypothetical protein [Candidatus Hydrogenedentota bacterium]HRT66998.1 hypothetical protein [Candidatus Hydrogenedentota bacterium]
MAAHKTPKPDTPLLNETTAFDAFPSLTQKQKKFIQLLAPGLRNIAAVSLAIHKGKLPADFDAKEFIHWVMDSGRARILTEDVRQSEAKELVKSLYPPPVETAAPKAGTVRAETNSGPVDWKTIRMRFSDDNPYVVLVARKGEKQKRVTAAELGLSDRRTGNLPNAQWALLKRFAEAPNKHIVPEVREAAAFKRAVSRLNRALTTAFGASNNPIVSLSKMHEREPWGKPKAGCGWHCLIDIA